MILTRLQFVNRDMFATEVGGINVIEQHVDVVDAVVRRGIVHGQSSLDVLLDDVSISVQRCGFNLVKGTFEFVAWNGFNFSPASNGSTCLFSSQVRRGQVRHRSIRGVSERECCERIRSRWGWGSRRRC